MTNGTQQLVYRLGLVSQRTPEPPRSVRVSEDLLMWDEPSITDNVSHYNIRVGTDTSEVKYRVPVGTTAIKPSYQESQFFVSSYNQAMKTESRKVGASGTIAGATAEAPGPVTNLAASSTIEWERGIPWQKVTIEGNAPAAESYNSFTGLLIFHTDSNSKQTRCGWVPLSTAAGDAFSFDVYVPAPIDPLQTERITAVSCNADVTATYATSPYYEFIGTAVPDDTLKDVTVAGTPVKAWQANGDLQLSALRTASPTPAGYIPPWIGNSPSNIGSFLGVDVFWENSDTPLDPYPAGAPPYTGTAGGTTPTNYGEVTVTIPRGYLTEGTHYLILRSYGKTNRLGWKQHTLLPSDCYWEIEITASELTANPSNGTTPGQPTGVSAIVRPGSTPTRFVLGAAFTPPATIGGTVGYAHRYRYWLETGKTNLHWPTDGTWIEAGRVYGANVNEIIAGEYERDGIPVYVEAAVAPFNDRNELGSWVVSSSATLVAPRSDETSGQGAAVSIAVGDGPDSRTYKVTATLTPPNPIGQAKSWYCEMGFFDAETGGTQTCPYTPLAPPIDISDTSEDFGPFPRGIDQEPWAELRMRIVYADDSTGGWIYADRKRVTKQVAPAATITNLSSIETALVSGKPSYRIVKKATFSGSKDAMDWTEMRVWFYTDAGGTTLDGEVDLGGIDPSVTASWPVTVEQKTDWWDRPGYTVYWKIGIRAKNSDGVVGAWVYSPSSGLTTMTASPGYDATAVDPTTMGGRLFLDGSTLNAYALTELAKWGLASTDFEVSGSNVILKAAVIGRLLAQSITVTSDMTITRASSGGVVTLDGDGVTLSKPSGATVEIGASSVVISGMTNDTTISSNGIACYKVVTNDVECPDYALKEPGGSTIATWNLSSPTAARLTTQNITCSTEFTHSGSTVNITSAANWRTALGLGTAATSASTDFAAASHTHSNADITGGATGTFTTADSKTVTVTNGIITSIV